ncbi:MAG: hypothetical protein WEB04_00415 [Dehalococcoidia bacterium]
MTERFSTKETGDALQRTADNDAKQYCEALRLFRDMVDRAKKSRALIQEFRRMMDVSLKYPYA